MKHEKDKINPAAKINEMIQIIPSLGWLALTMMFLVVIVGLLWLFFGSIYYKVHADGIIINEGGVYEVFSTGSGRVKDIPVAEGAFVKAGDVILTLSQPVMSEKIRSIKEQIKAIENKYKDLKQLALKNYRMQSRADQLRIEGVERDLHALEKQVELYNEKKNNEESLFKDGLISKNTLINTKQSLMDYVEKIRAKKNEARELEAKQNILKQDFEEKSFKLDFEVEDKERELREKLKELEQYSKVVATKSGKLIEMKVSRGDHINVGSPVGIIESSNSNESELKAVLYVNISDGKKVKKGLAAQLVPSTVKKEEHGFLLSSVENISFYPSTIESMNKTFRNNRLAEMFLQKNAVYEVTLKIHKKEGKHQWSSKKGLDISLSSGTMCSASIIVEERAPAMLFLPIFKAIFPD